MPVRFRKIIRVTPWLKMNISKGGVSFTVGKQGYHVNVSDEGVKQTIGLPGTGVSYQTYAGRDEDNGSKDKDRKDDGKDNDKGNGHEKSALAELGSVAGMAVVGELLDHDKPRKEEKERDDDADEDTGPRKSSRRRRRKGDRKARERSSGLRSTFILAAILVFFVAGAAALGLIPPGFFTNLGHVLSGWASALASKFGG